jgi:mannosyltransferase OCH1-like enzyme
MLAPLLKSGRFLRLVAIVTPLILVFFYILHVNWDPLHRSLATTQSPQSSKPSSVPVSNPEETAARPISSISPKPDSSDNYYDSPPPHSSTNNIQNDHTPLYKTAILGIPDKVWQSAKSNKLEKNQLEWVYTWTDKNPYHRRELLTDQSAETFVRAKFSATRPDLVELYESIPIPILRADLLRYLMVLADGGIWSDLDATCEKEVSEWVPEEYRDKPIDMIVGLEFDMEWHGEGTQVASQFCNWVFAARPSSRHLQAVVDAVADTLRKIAADNKVPMQKLQLEMLSDVVDVTGPKIMTVWVLNSLSKALDRPIDDREFHHIKQPKLIGDLLIMPGNSFAAAQNGYPDDHSDELVSHHYWGSWKDADKEAKEHKKKLQEEAKKKEEEEAKKKEEEAKKKDAAKQAEAQNQADGVV